MLIICNQLLKTDKLIVICIVLAKFKNNSNSSLSNIITRTSSSTPSLPDVSNDSPSTPVASIDQVVSADNLTVKV